MKECKIVSIPRNAFLFCKWTIALLLWLALILRIKELVLIACAILGLSAILKIRRAPLVYLYSNTVERIFKSKQEMLDENAMRFAHTMGAVMSGICSILLFFISAKAGWIFTGLLAIMKTWGAMGHCSALKLYGCMSNGACCVRKKNG